MGCTCPAPEDIPDADMPENLPPASAGLAFIAPGCEVHAVIYNRLREAAERGANQVIIDNTGKVLHEGPTDVFAVPESSLVDGVITTLRHAGLAPSLLTASACMSVGTSLCVASGLTREQYMDVVGKLWESCSAEHLRLLAARAAGRN